MSYFMNGLTDPDSLTRVEVAEQNAHLMAMTRSWAESHRASQSGDRFDTWAGEYFQRARREVVDTEGYERFFAEHGQKIDQTFRAFIGDEIQKNHSPIQ